MNKLTLEDMRRERDLQCAMDAAVEEGSKRELIPIGLEARLEFYREQIRRHDEGLPPMEEEGVIWRYREGCS